MKYLSIGQAAEVLGVSISTLRRWEKEGYYIPDYKTKGNHRRYCLSRLRKELLEIDPINAQSSRKTYAYARVSSQDQKLDLARQAKRLSQYCEKHFWPYEIIQDLGSGINYRKKGLNKLLNLIITNQVSRLVLTHKDRLLRFGSPLLFKICEAFNTEIVVLEEQKYESFEQELVADVIEIMTVFTAKMYGKRSHQNKKVCNG